MRETPFNTNPQPEPSPNGGGEEWRKYARSLGEHLKQKPTSNTGEDAQTKPAEEQAPTEEKPNAEGSGQFDDGKPEGSGDDFEDFKNNAEKKLNQFVEDPEEFAEILVEFGNLARIMFEPGIYHGLMYPGQEKYDIVVIRKKIIEWEKENKTPEDIDKLLNNYEKRLNGKWDVLQTAVQNVSYTPEQIKKLAHYIAKHIKDITVFVWMQKFDWFIYLAYLEFLHAKDIIRHRVADGITKKFGG